MKMIPKAITRSYGRTVLKAKKNSPHIMFGAGVAGVVGGTALACKATLKLEEHLDALEREVNQTKFDSVEALQEKSLAKVYGKHMWKIGKLYAPAIMVGGAGIACLTGAHVQLTKRNGVLTAAYAGVLKAYDDYRGRVREEVGDEKEMELYLAGETETIGNGKNAVLNLKVADVNRLSNHARIFDEFNYNYKPDAEWNRTFLQAQQNYFNQMLQVRGHVFLNEVYENLGFEHSRAGSIVGWVVTKESSNYIDFGIYSGTERANRFVNGDERAIILDFNVDGVIFDRI